MPEGPVRAIDSLDAAGGRRVLMSIKRATGASGFDAACAAAQRVLEGGRVPDDAAVDVLVRGIAAGGPAAEGDDPSACDGFLRAGGTHARWRWAWAEGRGGRQEVLAHDLRARGVVGRWQTEADRVPGGAPRGRGGEPRRPLQFEPTLWPAPFCLSPHLGNRP